MGRVPLLNGRDRTEGWGRGSWKVGGVSGGVRERKACSNELSQERREEFGVLEGVLLKEAEGVEKRESCGVTSHPE